CGAHRCGAATLLLRLSRDARIRKLIRRHAISTFVWSSVYRRIRTGITVGALERDTRRRDSAFPAVLLTRPSRRPETADAAASSGKGRIERVAARTCHALWPPGLCPRPPRLSPTGGQRATFAPRGPSALCYRRARINTPPTIQRTSRSSTTSSSERTVP